MSKRRTHSPEFKARVAMEAISGPKTIQEIAADHAIHPIQVSQWKRQLLDGASELFTRGKKSKDKEEGQAKQAELFQQIGKLQMELEWLKTNLSCSDARELRKLVDHEHPTISVSRQCALLGLPRSTLYYRPMPLRASTLRIMASIDAIYLEDPCRGSRRIVDYLAREGIPITRDRVRNLMRRLGLRAIYQKPRNTVPGNPSERFPCLVDVSTFMAVDQVCATDITYIPLQKGFLYLLAIVDLFSRNVLIWKLSTSLDTEFCLDAPEMALAWDRKPEIFHSDQGCQFTSGDFVARLQAEEIKFSRSGRIRCYENILVERLWRTVKYEEVYLHAYSDGWHAEISLARFLWRYCHVRPHSALGGRTPHEVYTEAQSCSSCPGLTFSGAGTVQ
ncbi:IS3 family transposase [Synechococcus sp. HK05]|uniref:IS3 family transposase n=1 Tax=Synechococcus sp. HK05 TaxID=2725975 RepID=UPI001C381D33|nr:IS3 family transposase [Synechococcus sp. HK05]MBV2352097.1 IS3 family transposase [Synechococcus sp. HK05]